MILPSITHVITAEVLHDGGASPLSNSSIPSNKPRGRGGGEPCGEAVLGAGAGPTFVGMADATVGSADATVVSTDAGLGAGPVSAAADAKESTGTSPPPPASRAWAARNNSAFCCRSLSSSSNVRRSLVMRLTFWLFSSKVFCRKRAKALESASRCCRRRTSSLRSCSDIASSLCTLELASASMSASKAQERPPTGLFRVAMALVPA